ncbi:MAG: serine acetyltransferase [Archangium sp.]|nr:serine acetyltransferase [Archangium sp.]
MSTLPPELIERLIAERRKHHVPSQLRPLAQHFVQQCLGVLFPHFAPTVVCSEDAVQEDLIQLEQSLARLERSVSTLHGAMPERLVERFFASLADVHQRLSEDARAIFEGDPAAKSVDEVLLTYPGFFAIAVFRVANLLHRLGMPLLPRLLTEVAHEKTGVDIHPGATIGRRFCIDHGTGIVIGETTHIGDGVKLYQGVTLGALTVEKGLADSKRHPTIGDEVVIYAGATILGGQTNVGHHSIVAGNAFVTTSVPANSVVTRKSEVRPRGPGSSMFDDLDFVI